MASTVFDDSLGTPIVAAWTNDVNTSTYSTVINAAVAPFNMLGDGTDESAKMQAALDYAASLMSASPTSATSGVAIYVPGYGKIYRLATKVNITAHAIAIISDGGRGACFTGDNILFDVGDYTDTIRVRDVHFENIYFASSNTANATAGVKLYRSVSTDFVDCTWANFDIGVDCYRASTPRFERPWFLNTIRTVDATAFMRLQGTDETDTTGETYTPGGGFHITDMEAQGARFAGGVEQNYTASGILINSCDGMYGLNIHITGCQRSVYINPLATAENHVATDIYFTQCYWDQPSDTAGVVNTNNVLLGGSVAPNIATAAGGTTDSIYQNIHFSNCYARGGFNVQRCVEIKITDTAGAFFADGRKVKDIQFIGGNIRQSTICGIQAHGGSTGSYYQVYGFAVHGVYFENHNSSSTGSFGSAITANVASHSISGNTYGTDTGTTDFIISINLASTGPTIGMLISGEDFSAGSAPAIDFINYTSTLNSQVLVTDNLPPGVGQRVDQMYTLSTTDATTTTIWSYLIPIGAAGNVTVDVSGSNEDGTIAVAYQFYTGYRNKGAGASLSTGGASWVTVRSWNPDAIATIPTATLDTTTLIVKVTGVAATNMTWVARVNLTQCK